MKPFRKDAWDLMVSNDLPRECECAAHSNEDAVLPFSERLVESLAWKLCHVKDLRGRNRSIGIGPIMTIYTVGVATGLVSVVDVESGDVVAVLPVSKKAGLKGRCELPIDQKTLAAMDLSDSVTSADAPGCQHGTAQIILERGGDYVLQVKSNQPNHEDVITRRCDENLMSAASACFRCLALSAECTEGSSQRGRRATGR